MRYQQQNNGIIERAFRRLSANEEKIVADGMCRLAEAGLEYLVDAHNSFGDLHHTHETDTLAYAVAKDGAIVRSEYLNGGDADIPGDAMQKAKTILSGTKGWAAIIISDMEGWYRVDWEMNFLHYSARQIKADFHKFFKKVK